MLDHWRTRTWRSQPLLAQLTKDGTGSVSIVGLMQRTGLTEQATRQLAWRLCKRGKLVRVGRGLFRVSGVGAAPELIAHAIRWNASRHEHWLAYRSAMAAYGFGPPLPHPEIQVSAAARLHPRKLPGGITVRYLACADGIPVEVAETKVAGLGDVPLPTAESVIVESLHNPRHVGGIKTVAQFMAHLRGKLDPDRIVQDALELDSPAVIRRAGALLELAGAARKTVEPLHDKLTTTYSLLDPTLPASGPRLNYWRLRLNASVDELQAILQPAAAAPQPAPAPSSAG